MDNDAELLIEQMRFFIHDGPKLLDEIVAAVEEQNPRRLELAAHRLKGLVARYGAPEATTLARQLEEMGSHGETADAAEISERLRADVAGLVAAIEDYVREHAE